MDGNGSLRKMVFTALFVFCGVGGGALGFKRAKAEFRRLGVVAEFKILGGIELDPSTAADFERLTGAPCLVADVATLTPERLREFFGDEAPDVVFFSPPCKQACGLLAKAIAYSPKYVKMGALAAEAIARQMLYTLVDAAMGSFSLSSGGAVWVRERELLRAEGTVLQ